MDILRAIFYHYYHRFRERYSEKDSLIDALHGMVMSILCPLMVWAILIEGKWGIKVYIVSESQAETMVYGVIIYAILYYILWLLLVAHGRYKDIIDNDMKYESTLYLFIGNFYLIFCIIIVVIAFLIMMP